MSKPNSLLMETAEALAASGPLKGRRALVGPDGFLDEIVRIVDQRTDFHTYTPVRTIADYAKRLAGAAGRSTNVELVLQQVKLGGNGPLMADALGELGLRVDYVGAVGYPTFHPVFEPLRRHGTVYPIADPAVTIAAEFEDGKIMHGKLQSLNDVKWSLLVERIGGTEVIDELLHGASLLAMLNWTMVPHLTEVWEKLSQRLKGVTGAGPSVCFFDLCDPEKRTIEDRRTAMKVIASFGAPGRLSVLGLNEKESYEICKAMNVEFGGDDHKSLIARARRLAEATGINEVVIHPTRSAAAYGPDGEGAIDGPFCAAPKLTTGAGDHFNGGYACARLAGLKPTHALAVGKAVSGFYVREGRGPTMAQTIEFLKRWAQGSVDPWAGPRT
jgi:hypothetical protein